MVKHTSLFLIRLYQFLVIILASSIFANAQEAFQRHFTMDDGLPASAVDQVSIARNGEIWVQYSSREFFSRFNGIEWKHYRMTDEGLPPVLTFFTEDDHGKWWHGVEHQKTYLACFTHDEKWQKYTVNTPTKYYQELNSGSPLLLDERYYEYCFNLQTQSFQRSKKPIYLPNVGEKLHGVNTSVSGQRYLVITNRRQNQFLFRFGVGFAETMKVLTPNPSHHIPYSLKKGHIESLLWRDGVLFWHSNETVRKIQVVLPGGEIGKVVQLMSVFPWPKRPGYPNQTAWMVKLANQSSSYIYTIDNNGNPLLMFDHFPETTFPFLAQGPQGSYWFGSSMGLFQSNINQLTFLENIKDMVNGIHFIHEDTKGQIWLGGYNGLGGFAVYNGVKLSRRHFDALAMPILPGSYRNSAGAIYFFMERQPGIGTIINDRIELMRIPGQSEQLRGYYFAPLKNGKIALGLQTVGLGLTEEKDGKLTSVQLIGQEKGLKLLNVLSISEDRNGRLWLSRSSQGIAVYDPIQDTAVTWLRHPSITNSIGAKCSLIDNQGNLWLGAYNGLYQLSAAHRFDYLHSNLFQHLKKIHLPGNDTTVISFITQSNLYLIVGTELGVYFLDKHDKKTGQPIGSLLYGHDIAGSGSQQNSVLVDSKGYLWVGANGATTRLKLKSLIFDTSATKIVLSNFQAGDSTINILNGQIGKIPMRKRNIRFTFLPMGNGFLKDNLYFTVVVIRNNKDTLYNKILVREKDHQLMYLPHGKYELTITTYKNNLQSGTNKYQFIIPRQLDESIWFWLMLSTLILASPLLFFTYQQRLKKQLLEQEAMAERTRRVQDRLKIQTLSGFFNPHFINNALHWVQSRYRGDAETTLVISKLADNVEMLYNNTQNGINYHPLSEEIRIVQNYLHIQQVRFDYEFSIVMDIPSPGKLDDCIHVPALLLQIHVENAIEKGIRGREGAGKFSLRLTSSSSGCSIIIEDDGQGRKPVLLHDRKGSVNVMNELIELLNNYNTDPILVEYEDLIYQMPEVGAYGTRVIIQLPKYFRYEFS